MDYKWARDCALALLNQYSVAGQTIPESYNNQADYLRRIPKLVNDAQMYIATSGGKIRAVEELANLSCDDNGNWLVYTLPRDFWQLCSGGLIRYDENNELKRCHLYRIIGADRIAVQKNASPNMSVEYYRLPRPLSDEPKDDEMLDNTIPAQMALPYYVAAHLVMYDNAFAYQALKNEFETRLTRLAEMPSAVYGTVEESYGTGNWGSCV